MFRASAIISLTTLLSRILGFVRDVLLAKFLGAGIATDAFFVALRLPNILRQLFAEGAFNVAFVPLLSKTLKEAGQEEAEAFSGAAFSILLSAAIGLTLVVMLFMPQTVALIAPGFHKNPAAFELTVQLSHITFPYFVFIVIISFFGGVLNTQKRFFAFALAPSVLNLSFIFALFFLPKYTEAPVFAAAWALPLGGVLQVILLFFAFYRSGLKLRLHFPRQHPRLRQLFTRMGPTLIGVGAQQISTFLGTVLASFAATGSISYLFYADRLNQLPLALIGIALATALLPTLTEAFLKDKALATQTLKKALTAGAALGFAAAGGLFILAPEIVKVLFMRGAFNQEATAQTAYTLMAYSVGLPAYLLLKVTSTAFYAQHDTKTPVKASLISISLGVIFMLSFMPFFAHIGLAFATSLAGWAGLTLQFKWLRTNGLRLKLYLTLIKCALAAAVMVFTLYAFKGFFPMPEEGFISQSLWLMVSIFLGIIIWASAIWGLRLRIALKRTSL